MSLYTEKSSRIRLANRIKNMKGRSTSSEVDPSILAPKGAVHFKNENIRYDKLSFLIYVRRVNLSRVDSLLVAQTRD
jgi:hypothetical protein